jgi:hypothetical protein
VTLVQWILASTFVSPELKPHITSLRLNGFRIVWKLYALITFIQLKWINIVSWLFASFGDHHLNNTHAYNVLCYVHHNYTDVLFETWTEPPSRVLWLQQKETCLILKDTEKKKLHGLSPRANYTYRATAAYRWSDCQLVRIEGATWSAWRIPPAVFLGFLDRSRYFSIK